MKIYKEINIDLDKWVKKLKNPKVGYSESEKFKLGILYADFAEGRLQACMEYAMSWSREERELIPCDIWDVLFELNIGYKYKTEEDFEKGLKNI